jgi:hypothetical protein
VSRVQPLISIPVGVVIERCRAKNPWADFVWRPIAVLPGVPDAEPWTVLESDADRTYFYGGIAEIELYQSDAAGYRDNLKAGVALLWVVLRSTGRQPPFEIAAVTAEPSEGEAFAGNVTDLVETVPMPGPVRALIAEFVAQHYSDHRFIKRKRDRADSEAMARHPSMKGRK